MPISVRIIFKLFCLRHNLHLTYPRAVLFTLNEPHQTHFFPLKKLAAHPKTFFRPVTIRVFYLLVVTKPTNYLNLYPLCSQKRAKGRGYSYLNLMQNFFSELGKQWVSPTYGSDWIAVAGLLFVILVLWSVVWKGLALWTAAHEESKPW